jgi:hypothetical protein
MGRERGEKASTYVNAPEAARGALREADASLREEMLSAPPTIPAAVSIDVTDLLRDVPDQTFGGTRESKRERKMNGSESSHFLMDSGLRP